MGCGRSRLLWNARRWRSGLSDGRRFAACVAVSCRIGEAERLAYPPIRTPPAKRTRAKRSRVFTSAGRDRPCAAPDQEGGERRHRQTAKQERCRFGWGLLQSRLRHERAYDEEV